MEKNHIIALNGGKRGKKDSTSAQEQEGARLIIGDEEFELTSFVLSGEGVEGRRMLFSWNCSLDEMISYAKILDVMVHRKVDDAIHE